MYCNFAHCTVLDIKKTFKSFCFGKRVQNIDPPPWTREGHGPPFMDLVHGPQSFTTSKNTIVKNNKIVNS